MGVERSAKKNRQTQQKNAPQCKSFLGLKTGESISCTGSCDAVFRPKMLEEKRRRCKREFFIFLGNCGKWWLIGLASLLFPPASDRLNGRGERRRKTGMGKKKRKNGSSAPPPQPKEEVWGIALLLPIALALCLDPPSRPLTLFSPILPIPLDFPISLFSCFFVRLSATENRKGKWVVSPRRAFPLARSLHRKVSFANNLRIPAQNKKGKKAEAEIGSGGIQYRLPPLLFRVRLRRKRKKFSNTIYSPYFCLGIRQIGFLFPFLKEEKGKGLLALIARGCLKTEIEEEEGRCVLFLLRYLCTKKAR